MAQILVKSPVTSNGRDPIMKDGKIVYKETIVDERARPIFEKINSKLPTHLKKIIEPVTSEQPKPEVKEPVVKKSKTVKRGAKSRA